MNKQTMAITDPNDHCCPSFPLKMNDECTRLVDQSGFFQVHSSAARIAMICVWKYVPFSFTIKIVDSSELVMKLSI